MKISKILLGSALCLGTFACDAPSTDEKKDTMQTEASADSSQVAPVRTEVYATVKLTSDLSVLSEKEKQMLPKLIEVAQIMDSLFWYQAYGDKAELLAITSDPKTQAFLAINYSHGIGLPIMQLFCLVWAKNPKLQIFTRTTWPRQSLRLSLPRIKKAFILTWSATKWAI